MATAAPTQPPSTPSTVLMTAEEFARLHGGDYVELVRGHVVEQTMPFPKHGKICNNTAYYITSHAFAHDSGHVMTNDSFVRTERNPDTVRGADISYWSYDRLPKGPIPEGLLSVAPDLTVEVRSPSDRWKLVIEKVGEYLEAGVRVVIVLDPQAATAHIYRKGELPQIFDNGDDLLVPDVLPGFAVPVAKLFE